jgi:hypothetical protein
VAQQSFGRRINPQRRFAGAQAIAQNATAARDEAPAERLPAPAATADSPSLDDELREWKQARKSGFRVPWRQLSLMASLCFGIASFVLPDSVNDNVQWLLYALMAASLYVGFSKRLRKAVG